MLPGSVMHSPVGTSLLFPCETAMVTHRAKEAERGQILGVQQAFGAVSRIIAPIWATAAYQGVGQSMPFFLGGGIVGVVAILAFSVQQEPHPVREAA